MRAGIVGAGRMGSIHARSLAAAGHELVVHDRDAAAGAALARQVDGDVADLDELLERCDALVVATPANERMPLLLRALSTGLPIFCEKPLATSVAQGVELVDAADHHGATVHMGFQRRCDPQYLALRRRIETGRLGRPLMVRATAYDHRPPPEDYAEPEDGIFADCLIHDIDAATWLTGQEPVGVLADGAQLLSPSPQRSYYDIATLVITYAGGCRAVLTASRMDPLGYDHRMEILGTADSVSVGLTGRSPLHLVETGAPPTDGSGPAWRGFSDRFAEGYKTEMRVFADMVTNGTPSPCSPREALTAQRVAAAAALSARTGRHQLVH
ncbi:Gfo/Idh/MocA family protein [Saccharopolyspora spinosa]|uniref:Myo-inositol 2-dehydrogenase/D-chiro-inositol 1-dehydrogenase n=1 Tax=Saccharopolyspora spinosa TaxID=60894 RepID=A0A2N3Y0T6_SACSN|nr:Gfo/Idh/MocA family oxidoreductase [Saccharopolyspora spinosa]PKW16544.1 myo-inositol 2-dehydrogenase/D-chiro-inositol 1-dehydrogenase [Saccharopolyspora spinosa]